MKTLLLGLAVLLISACGKQNIDPAFQSIVSDFEQESINHGKPTKFGSSITFGDLHNDTSESTGTTTQVAAQCNNGFLSGNNIVVDQNAWNGLTPVDQEEVIFHELGHCALGRGHSNEMQWNESDGYEVAVSVMNIARVNVNAYSANRESYIDELFNGKNENE